MAADPAMAAPLPDAPGYWAAEVVHACLNEGACRLDDVVDRRLRFGLNLDAVTPRLVRATAEIMGAHSGVGPSGSRRVGRGLPDGRRHARHDGAVGR